MRKEITHNEMIKLTILAAEVENHPVGITCSNFFVISYGIMGSVSKQFPLIGQKIRESRIYTILQIWLILNTMLYPVYRCDRNVRDFRMANASSWNRVDVLEGAGAHGNDNWKLF